MKNLMRSLVFGLLVAPFAANAMRPPLGGSAGRAQAESVGSGGTVEDYARVLDGTPADYMRGLNLCRRVIVNATHSKIANEKVEWLGDFYFSLTARTRNQQVCSCHFSWVSKWELIRKDYSAAREALCER